MLTDGSLMRLGQDDFNTLMNEPMLQWVDFEAGQQDRRSAGGKWLDVRLPSEFESYHQDGAINIPLYFIRLKLKTLDPKPLRRLLRHRPAQQRGAFILSERGFDATCCGRLTMADAGHDHRALPSGTLAAA
jgi:rhodanese-related sulfurtransferase